MMELLKDFCQSSILLSGMLFRKKRDLPTVSFATSCWEKDWKLLLQEDGYLEQRQIGNHLFAFSEKLLIINNVRSFETVLRAAERKVEQGVLTEAILAEEIAKKVLTFFHLKRSDFRPGGDASLYESVDADWIYYNALGPLSAIYYAKSDYLLYLTGDVYLEEPYDWIGRAIAMMEKKPHYKVANLVWNKKVDEAKRESMARKKGFFISDCGFSDQMFLIKLSDFQAPIYREIREDASHFPRGDVFEKRVFSAMRNRGWLRLTDQQGSYIHENV